MPRLRWAAAGTGSQLPLLPGRNQPQHPGTALPVGHEPGGVRDYERLAEHHETIVYWDLLSNQRSPARRTTCGMRLSSRASW